MNFAERFNLKLKGLMLVSVPLGFQILFVFFFFQLLLDIDREFDRQYESQGILAQLRKTENTITRGLLVLVSANLENQDAPEEEIRKLKVELKSALQFFEELKVIRPNLINNISTNQKTARDALALLDTVQVVFGKGSKIPNTKRFKLIRTDSYSLFGRSQKDLRKLIDSEMQVRLASPALVSKSESMLMVLVLAGICIDILLAWWLVKFFTDDLVLRLSQAADNARSIAIEKPFAFKVTGTDEVARLNRQLERAAANLNERRQRERAILQSAEDAILSVDDTYRVVAASGAIEALFFENKSEILGKPVIDLLAADRRNYVQGFFEDVFKTGKVSSIETQRTMPDRAAPERAAHGRAAHGIAPTDGAAMDLRIAARRSVDEKFIVAIVQDISKRKQLERIKQQFVSMVSHDVRTPLASVTSALSLIVTGVKGNIPEQAKKAVAEAELESMRLTERIQNILDVERLESGVLELQREHASLFDAVDEAVSLIDALLKERKVIVKREFKDFSLKSDRYWLSQAIKHLLISIVASGEPGGTVEITAKDCGANIEVLINRSSAAFDESVHLYTELNQSIARTIVSKLGGKISVRAEEDEISFTLTFEKFELEEADA
jgi:PAS domain S-box-containing protein